jgi:hypothetical protein
LWYPGYPFGLRNSIGLIVPSGYSGKNANPFHPIPGLFLEGKNFIKDPDIVMGMDATYPPD